MTRIKNTVNSQTPSNTAGMSTRPFDFDSSYGSTYEATVRRAIPAHEHTMRMTAALLAARLPENAHILVVGAGGGMEVCELGAARPGWHITGVDPSALMIDIARDRVARNGLSQRVTLVQGTADALPAEPLYDAATCMMVMHMLPDTGAKAALLAPIAARLKPGAPLILTDAFGDALPEGYVPAWRWFQRGMGRSEEEITALELQVRAGVHFVPEARIAELLAEAGFSAPVQFFHAFWFGGWMTEKGSGKLNGNK
ncbi:MAG TPA: class I SAM-dependent methyltransferase [Candidatus Limnocylindrales bacterium]|nr:class I SAM-dependent methyltransferase [Candidatus Limnocylindrales bacterium]